MAGETQPFFSIIKIMRTIRQNIENLRYAIKWHTFTLTRDQQDALLLLLDTLENQLKTYEALNKKGI